MRWYKHFTDSLDDPFIQALMDKFEHAGYVAWFGLIEIISKENGRNLTGKLSISPQYLRRKLRISTRKLRQIYEYCAEYPAENPDNSPTIGKLSVNFLEKKWTFNFPKILALKDNYTKDLQGAGKKPSNHKEVEVEEEKENPPISPQRGNEWGELFGKKYNERLGHEYAWDGGAKRLAIKDGTAVPGEIQGAVIDLYLNLPREFNNDIKKYGYNYTGLHQRLNDLITKAKAEVKNRQRRAAYEAETQRKHEEDQRRQEEEEAVAVSRRQRLAELPEGKRKELKQQAEDELKRGFRIYRQISIPAVVLEAKMVELLEKEKAAVAV